jgi:hypothetical protein
MPGHLQARTNLAIEEGGLPCYRLQQGLHRLEMGHGTGAQRPRGPLGVRSSAGRRPGTPGPRMDTGQVVYVNVGETFRGIKH